MDSNGDLRKVVMLYQESEKKEENGTGKGQSMWICEAERCQGQLVADTGAIAAEAVREGWP